jgi:hypothetical protein
MNNIFEIIQALSSDDKSKFVNNSVYRSLITYIEELIQREYSTLVNINDYAIIKETQGKIKSYNDILYILKKIVDL